MPPKPPAANERSCDRPELATALASAFTSALSSSLDSGMCGSLAATESFIESADDIVILSVGSCGEVEGEVEVERMRGGREGDRKKGLAGEIRGSSDEG